MTRTDQHSLTHTDAPLGRRETVGAALWVAIAQYFVMLLVVQAAWATPYSIVRNAISDLGAVGCGKFEDRQVCSPWHAAANTSWTLAGLSILLGAVLLWRVFAKSLASRVGLALAVATGLGEFLVGLNPEDSSSLHVPAAMLAILGGLSSLLIIGTALARTPQWKALGRLGVAFGLLGALSAAVLLGFAPHHLFGLFERIAAYPILVWMIVAGAVVLRRSRTRR